MSKKAMIEGKGIFKASVLAVAVATALVGCGGGGGTAANPDIADVATTTAAGIFTADIDGATVTGAVVEVPCAGAKVTPVRIEGGWRLTADMSMGYHAHTLDANGLTTPAAGAVKCKDVDYVAAYTGEAELDLNALSTMIYTLAEAAAAEGGSISDHLETAENAVYAMAPQLVADTTDEYSLTEVISQIVFAVADDAAGQRRFLKLLAYDLADGLFDGKYDKENAAFKLSLSTEDSAAVADVATKVTSDVREAAQAKARELVIALLDSAHLSDEDKIKLVSKMLGKEVAKIDDVVAIKKTSDDYTAKEFETERTTISVEALGGPLMLAPESKMTLGSAVYEAPAASAVSSTGVATYTVHSGLSSVGDSGFSVELQVAELHADATVKMTASVEEQGSSKSITIYEVPVSLIANPSDNTVSAATLVKGIVDVSHTDSAGVVKTASLSNSSDKAVTVSTDGKTLIFDFTSYIDKAESQLGTSVAIDQDKKYDVSISFKGVKVEVEDATDTEEVRIYTIKASGVTGIGSKADTSGGDTSAGDTSAGDTSAGDTSGGDTSSKGTLLTAGDSSPNSGKYELSTSAPATVAVYAAAAPGTADSKATPIAVNVEIESGTVVEGKYTVIKIDPAYDGVTLRVELTHESTCKSGDVVVGADGNSGVKYALLDGTC